MAACPGSLLNQAIVVFDQKRKKIPSSILAECLLASAISIGIREFKLNKNFKSLVFWLTIIVQN